MRINFVLPCVNRAGGIRVLAMHAQMLAARGHQVSVRSKAPAGTNAEKWLVRKRQDDAGRNGSPPDSHFAGLNIDHQLSPPDRPILDCDVPDGDVVIASWWETAEWVAGLSPNKGQKTHFIQHDESMFAGQPEQRVIQSWRLPMPKLAVSRWLVELARARNPDMPCYEVPNGVDADLFNGRRRDKQQVPTVGFMYSRSEFKGADLAKAVVDNVRRSTRALRVVSFGMDAPTWRKPLPRRTHYEYKPTQRRIAALYQSVDAWLVPSRSEGFGLPVLEAMACRTPVIATATGAAPEILREGGGFVVERDGGVAAMADSVKRVLRMEESQWQAMADRAREVARRYSWSCSADCLEAALNDVVGAKSNLAIPSQVSAGVESS